MGPGRRQFAVDAALLDSSGLERIQMQTTHPAAARSALPSSTPHAKKSSKTSGITASDDRQQLRTWPTTMRVPSHLRKAVARLIETDRIKRIRDAKRAEGFCTSCLTRPARQGMSTCQFCSDRSAAAKEARRARKVAS